MRSTWQRALIHLVAWTVGLIWIIPFMGILMSSIRPHGEIVHGWWQLAEINISLNNFVDAWTHSTAPMGEGMRNSLLVAIPATLLPLFVGTLAAYGFSRLRFVGRNAFFVMIVLLLAIPQQMVAIPLFRIMQHFGLVDTFHGLVLAHTAWALPWITLFMRNYMSTLPAELEEAAFIDGANRFQVFIRIVLPLCIPGLASMSALQFTWVWNDFFLALILLYNPDSLVITQRIPLLRGQFHVDWGVLSAASMLTMLVPVLVFILLQKYYIRGFIGWTLK